MKTIFLRLMLLLSAASLTCSASENVSPQRLLLWRVQGPTPHYIFGTIHLPDPRVTTLSPVVEKALTSSDVVLTEIKMDDSAIATAAQAMILPADQSLSEILQTGTRQAVNKELQLINPALTLAAFDRMKPWAFAASLPVLEMQLKYAGAPALDVVLAQRAKQNEGIETLQEQLDIFEGMSRAQQLQMLDFTLREMQENRAKGTDAIEEMLKTYLSGDEKALNELVNHWATGYADAADLKLRLLTNRNILMAKRIDERLRKSPKQALFIAVGAAHLVGEGNIIELLKQRGLKIERVNN